MVQWWYTRWRSSHWCELGTTLEVNAKKPDLIWRFPFYSSESVSGTKEDLSSKGESEAANRLGSELLSASEELGLGVGWGCAFR